MIVTYITIPGDRPELLEESPGTRFDNYIFGTKDHLCGQHITFKDSSLKGYVMNTPLSCFGSSAACYLLNSRVEHKTSPIQFRQGTWITKVSPVQLQCFFRLKSKNIWCVWNEEQPGKEAYQGSRPDHWPVTSSYVALKPPFLKKCSKSTSLFTRWTFEVYGGCLGFVCSSDFRN